MRCRVTWRLHPGRRARPINYFLWRRQRGWNLSPLFCSLTPSPPPSALPRVNIHCASLWINHKHRVLTTANVAALHNSHPTIGETVWIYLAIIEDGLLFEDTPAITLGSRSSDFRIDTSFGSPRSAPARTSKTYLTNTSINKIILLFFADILPPSPRVDNPCLFSLLYPSYPHSLIYTTCPLHIFPYNPRPCSSAPLLGFSLPSFLIFILSTAIVSSLDTSKSSR